MTKKEESYILKKMKEELGNEPWRTQFPSSTVSLRIEGDHDYAMRYRGEAKRLLYSVKNRMRLGNLKSFGGNWSYSDGTIIRVKSFFGQDIVEINAGIGLGSCSITLFNVPEVVPPMEWYASGTETFTKIDNVWIINKPDGTLEVEGVDYIKTYYSFTTKSCPSCSLDFTVGKEVLIIEASTPHRPFIYKSEKDNGSLIYTYDGIIVPHYMGDDSAIPPVLPDPLNHSIYSLYNHCEAEIIKFDSDSGGTYFLWKAYTEWSNVGPSSVDFSRTGLGYMLLRGFSGNICISDPFIIKVDCCEKPSINRQTNLWWESLTAFQAGGPTCGGQSFMFYGDMKICEVPSEVAGIYVLLCVPANQKILYTIPEIKGGCLPFEWSVSNGAFIITPFLPFGEKAALEKVNCSELLDCNQGFSVTVRDRCGTEDTVRFISCCEWLVNPSLFISYTSLSMGCSASQTLSVGGQGCDPYTWSKTGAGTLDTTTGDSVIYTAPATNVNCANNDTVTVTDCCGNSATITLYVSCNPAGSAYQICTQIVTSCVCDSWYGGVCMRCAVTGTMTRIIWDCLGNILSQTVTATDGSCSPSYDCPGCPGNCNFGYCNPYGCPGPCETYTDLRTPTMKTNGCCPINPSTGLPF